MGKKIDSGFSSCHLVAAVILSAASVPSAIAGRLAWVPVSATGSHTINGNDITLIGANQQVTLELRVSNWDPDLDGTPTLGAFQGTVDAGGYSNGIGTSLTPVTAPSVSAGAFIAASRCTVGQQAPPTGAACIGPADCPGEFCAPNPAYVFTGFSPFLVLATVTPYYEFGGVAGVGSKTDNGTVWYGGTLVLNVPTGAKGDYVIGFFNDVHNNYTFMNDATGLLIVVTEPIPATIKVGCGSNADCEDNNPCTIDRCGVAAICTNNPRPAGFACEDALFCNGVETCDGAGACISPGAACSGLPSSTCDEILGCVGPGNFNGDPLINLEDWINFSGCLNGPGIVTPGSCIRARFDVGNDVDLVDSAAFLNVFTGN